MATSSSIFLKIKKADVPFIFFSGSQEIKSAEMSAPVLKCFSKSEVFHLIEYVEFLWSQTAQRAVV